MYTCLTLYILNCLIIATVYGNVMHHYNGSIPKLPTKVISNNEEPRIIGGFDAGNGDFPYQVAVISYQEESVIFCGGSVLNASFIITAGHCVEKDLAGVATRVSLNGITYDKWNTTINAKHIHLHEGYSVDNKGIPINDIALIELQDQLLDVSSEIQEVALQKTSVPIGTPCVVSGWGVTNISSTAHLSETLQYVNVFIEECDIYDSDIKPGMICAGVDGGGRDTCRGDSGGPLVCDGKLVGIVSWGHGCAEKKYPGVYTDVSHYYSWITSSASLSSAFTAFTFTVFVFVVL